ncbi:hypothetical protein G7L40_19945 [Paenibacillus polymyxa]|uniref:Uncharacterized protein n=1 Tax=Paenibacillus polymyxa TaxID=1406 RepID=A0A378Y1U3_PAEPO|nr:hypothetical protein [Paenibacillus polymyxa]KAF6630523.1 hypothetical protein H6F38_13915 [Paenibacillus sp. EKM208P]MBE7896238.1 hypothetical protein [Paenibacillus polymyxa]MCC3256767.1 hypothetical protein [Paenibacillus polymyxa]QPK54746.1 hypothetical protein G7035_19985 [Paenibacillus polymyxa]QPK59837.1 hypothetical protein G7L40_19945 [Paenibacillus polymyxa]
MKSEAATRLSIAILMFVLASFMPNWWSISIVSFVGLYSLTTGLIKLRKVDKP